MEYKLYYLTSKKDDLKPRYVGYTSSGLKERLRCHIKDCKNITSHKTNWIKAIKSDTDDIFIVEICSVKTLDMALKCERILIESYSKKYKLTNSTNGGETSKSTDPEVKRKISNSLKKYYKTHNVWCKGKRYHLSEESRRSMIEKIGDRSGENNSFYRKQHSDETKKIIGDKNRKYRIVEYDELYDLYIDKNMMQKDIAKLLDMSRKNICKLVKKFKLMNIKKEKYGKIKTIIY